MGQYKVKSNLWHNKQEFKAGSVVELDEKQAAILLKDGVVESQSGPSKPSQPEKMSEPEQMPEPEVVHEAPKASKKKGK